MESSYEHPCSTFGKYFGMNLCLLFMYGICHFIGFHINDSYHSFVEIDCFAFSTETCKPSYKDWYKPCGWIWELDLNSICNSDLSDYVFLVHPIFDEYYYQDYCWLNTVDLTVRTGSVMANDGSCSCACKSCARCGNIGACTKDGCCLCCNCIGYSFCFMVVLPIFCIWLCFSPLFAFGGPDQYQITMKESMILIPVETVSKTVSNYIELSNGRIA